MPGRVVAVARAPGGGPEVRARSQWRSAAHDRLRADIDERVSAFPSRPQEGAPATATTRSNAARSRVAGSAG